ncbi:outer membrane protein with beta-barrel domain [Ulvibacter sp. MAR_2010_11]|uniref:porin family protein n=1 Tax=Ulvibacter sp. MAR_2010_11 TaxID=1250229 RepID=UPI000C2CA486|nr:porin family protein [Ulvibacter sp. MAR_2010_11]PKA84305.1 outer membrane protein with beta-barrel domain [Ulvibacter sp. MAR_2010_11]
MKKLILFALAVGMFTTSSAQGIDLGVKAGVNFASLTDASGLSNRTGFVAGIFAGGKFNDNVGLQADLLYSQQGAEFEGEKFELNYVNVPIVLKYFIFQGLNIQAGPQFGFIVDDNTQSLFGEIFNDAATKDFDLSGVVGLGYDLPLGLRVDGRYNFGLSDVFENFGDSKSKNSVVTLSIGYSFL